MKPGKRTQPATSMIRSASALSPRPRETTFSPSTSRSARRTPLPETTLPPLNSVRISVSSILGVLMGIVYHSSRRISSGGGACRKKFPKMEILRFPLYAP